MKQVLEQLTDAFYLQQSSGLSLSIEEVKNLQQIPLQDILLATNEFAYKNVIGSSKHGKLYKGVSKKHGRITIRRLNRGLGNLEFMTEIAYLEEHRYANIGSFLGHCDEGGEKIIVYQDQSNGSLHEYVGSVYLSWLRRLRIAMDVARAMKYLDDSDDIDHIVNRHFKSSNIFLDEDLKPKGFDFGSSIFHSNMRGTTRYNYPDDFNSNDLTHKKSGVYSLGVVLWELLCGRSFTSDEDDPQSLHNLVRKHYKNQTLHSIIPSYLFKQINKDSLITYSTIAYRCLNNEEERPTLREVEEQLQKVLDQQLLSDCSSHQDLN
ncbi:putative receptor-like protein kinase At2g23200 [Bidens hawaiensis]|uniref:putative receptor-like protein kinase At2g23200 n=1 Tax=Bidens hawaiensis TaxID=980011 RepID=UPI00404B3259